MTIVRFENPYAKDVLVLTNNFDGNAQDLIDYIEEEVIKYGYSIQEIGRLVKNLYGEEIFNIHHGTSGTNSESQQEWKSSNRQNDGILSREQDGKRISNKSTDSTKRQFSLKSDSLVNRLTDQQVEFFKDSKNR